MPQTQTPPVSFTTFETTLDVLSAFFGLVEEGTYTEEELEKMNLEELERNFMELVLIPFMEKNK